MDANKIESVLMLIPSNKTIYPVSTLAFSMTQSGKKELNNNVGAIVLWECGSIRKIISIKKNGLYGVDFLSRFKSALVGAYKIDVIFEDVNIEFSELASLIADYFILDSKSSFPSFEFTKDVKLIEKEIRLSKNSTEIFSIISMPPLEDCLDIL